MPATENQPSFLGRISIRRNQIIAMDGNHEQELEDLELFQRHIGKIVVSELFLKVHLLVETFFSLADCFGSKLCLTFCQVCCFRVLLCFHRSFVFHCFFILIYCSCFV